MSRYWTEKVKNIKPYVPGEQPKDRTYVKLNTNENPYPPSPKVFDAIRRATDETLRLYPDPQSDALREAIAARFGLKKDNTFIGNGSDELLAFCFPAFFEPEGKPILFAEITYSFYPVYAEFFGVAYRLIPVDENFNVLLDGYFSENGGILIANPNAPTGKGLTLETVETIVGRNPESVVILDEAYIDFGGTTAASLIPRYPNLLVVRTLSKSYSLAGLRVGFALGHEDLIEGLARVRDSINSYTVDRLAQAGARAALEDDAYFQETRSKIVKTRDRVSQALALQGFRVIPSEANFVFISHPLMPARSLFAGLREKGVLVRYFDKRKIDHCLRVTIGTDEEMDRFLKAVEEICKA